jgi:hypothetical protein
MTHRKFALALCTLLLTVAAVPTWAQETGEEPTPWTPDRPWEAIDLVIALDTSDSMERLIDAARLALWDLVNELARAEPPPQLRVALVTYGHSDHDREAGWVRIDTDLTADLDVVSDRLFALTTDGGREYVARALETALDDLAWVPSYDALKIVLVAGNEAADQDPDVHLRDVGVRAQNDGVVVLAIYCGSDRQPDADSWRAAAEAADGHFAAIDHRGRPIVVSTPVDEQLVELGAALNATFIPIGEQGEKRRDNLERQDRNASKMGSASAAARARTKASARYTRGWDLVSELEAGRKTLADIPDDELPEELRSMILEERDAYVAEMRTQRAELQRRIEALSAERRASVAAQVEAKGIDRSSSFAGAVLDVLRREAEAHGFVLPEE